MNRKAHSCSKKICILMAVYNGEKYIAEQITSILNQTHQNIHLIIRDNSSEDHTREIVQEFIKKHPDKITLLTSFVNVGIIRNFAALLDNAKGDYFMFSDHDDVWLPKKIEKTLKKMEELENKTSPLTPLLVHTDLKVVDAKLKVINPSFWKYSKLNPFRGQTLSRLLLQNQVTGCTMMINQSLKHLATPIPKNVVMHDWWFALSAAAFGQIGIVEEATMLYRQHASNDVGAKTYGLSSFLKNKFNKKQREKLRRCRIETLEQAQVFLETYLDRLTQSCKEVVQAFIKFDQAIFLGKAWLMIKYGFYRVGFLRNLYLVFGPRNLRLFLRPFQGKFKEPI